jgi:2'-hydroxyisoflavone reductase
MRSTRREFLRTSPAFGAAAAPGGPAGLAGAQQAAKESNQGDGKGLQLLILGGTIFLGPALVEAAQKRGHRVTLFNRGKHNADLFPELEKLRGDRNPDEGDGLKALVGRKWDAVLDDCGYYPRHVKASAELLGPNVKHYVFVSSISCYAENKVEGADESAALATLDDPAVETMGEGYANYGGLKALCEQAAEAAMPGRVANVRPGFIVGPRDQSGRFAYWPVRVERGGEVLAPGATSDPIQVIDVRDLAEWMLHLAEQHITGVFNACGPRTRMSMREVLDACKQVAKSDARFTWVPAEFLGKQTGVDPPIWVPHEGDSKGFHTWSNARAVNAGLKFRTIADTAGATLEWWKAQPEDRREKLRGGMSAEKEAELLAAWYKESVK